MQQKRSCREDSSALSPAFTMLPAVEQNANPRVPLAAVVRFAADRPVWTTVEVSDGDRQWQVSFDRSRNPQDGLPILGLRPNRRHEFRVAIGDWDGDTVRAPGVLEYTTPPLPEERGEFPPLRVTVSRPEEMEPGVTLISARRRFPGKPKTLSREQRAFMQNYTILLALDAEGEVIWYYRADARISDVKRMWNGNLLYMTTDYRAVEIDMLGNTIASWYADKRPLGPVEGSVPVDAQTFHHFIEELPSGNLLVFTAKAQEVEAFYTSESDPHAPRQTAMVMGDEIIEFQRDGTIVWRWNAFDWLDPYRIGYEALGTYWHVRGFPGHHDWTHGNGLYLDERDDSLIVSLRFQDALLKVDHKSGEIRWILGEPGDWPEHLRGRVLQPVGETRLPYHQHAPSITPSGTLLVFDNGTFGARPFDPPVSPAETYSRAVEYAIDEQAMTVRQVWESDRPGPTAAVAFAMGDAHRLPQTGNTLVAYGLCPPQEQIDQVTWDNALTFPSWTRVREVRHSDSAEVVWEVVLKDESDDPLGWTVFGADRLPSLIS